jgi:hypothetical protein
LWLIEKTTITKRTEDGVQITTRNGRNLISSLEENGQIRNESGDIWTAIFNQYQGVLNKEQPLNLEYTMLNHINAHLAPEQQNELLAPCQKKKSPGLDSLTYEFYIRNFLILKN